MSNPKAFLNRIRGWLPKDPALSSTVTAQANPNIRHRLTLKNCLAIFIIPFATVLIMMALMHGLGLGNNYATSAAVGIGILATVAVSVLFREPIQNQPLTKEGRRVATIIGVVNVGMIGVFLGTYLWINPNLASEITLGLWIALLAAFFLVNNLLYRNLKKQINMESV
ncbi:MAG: hypothetical protein NWE92_00225 [Candidatus Bathyarchaeota archaeon]|nr:hypothetical protein [Candidatus Bathyarchaeota archaeon]